MLEVETPLLCKGTGTDPQLDYFSTRFHRPPDNPTLFLQSSPEFAMKRLLAAGSGSIFQICKAFRNGESGRYHNPEFSILEWYRVGFTLQQLMAEVSELLTGILDTELSMESVQTVSYQQVFKERTGLDPLDFVYQDYCRYAENNGVPEAISMCGRSHSLWLDFIFSHHIQPELGRNALSMVYDYPAVQSSLARTNQNNPKVVERFEVFIDGVELANGYCELTDAREQKRRFEQEIEIRQRQGVPAVVCDERFLGALKSGLPVCSGVAIGLDRLLMVLTASCRIDEVLAFPVSRA